MNEQEPGIGIFLVRDGQREAFREILRGMVRPPNGTLPGIIIFALICARLWPLFPLPKRMAGQDLAFVPSHPDRAGSPGFIEKLPKAFSLVAFAISAAMVGPIRIEIWNNADGAAPCPTSAY